MEEQPGVGEEEAEALRQDLAQRQSHDLASPRFFAGALLGGAERVGQPLRRAARAQRLGLGLVWRPAVQEKHLEARRDAAGRQREALAVDLRRAQERGPAAPGRAGARPPGCSRPWRRGRASGRAHCRTRPRWSRCRPPAGRSPRAAAGPPRRADRRKARRVGSSRPRPRFRPRSGPGAAATAWRRPAWRPAGGRRGAGCAGSAPGCRQVVDPMEVHGAHDQVEALGREGQEFLVRHDRRAARSRRSRDRGRRAPASRRSCGRPMPRRTRRRASRDRAHAQRSGARRRGVQPGGSRSRA